ncbi:MAG: hypothetical protein ACRC2K_13160 [Clostridium sp.]
MINICRLALFNKKATGLIEEKYGLEKYLDVLEKACGGHGNGLVLTEKGVVTFFNKGMDLTNEEITRTILSKDFDYAIYHTRVASQGSKKDSNCHPYVTTDNKFALCMNGTERSFGEIGKLNDITDTEVIYRLFSNNYDIDIRSLTGLSSRFLGLKNGKVFACNSSYGGLEYFDEDGALCIASQFPYGIGIKTNKLKNSFWLEGEELEKKEEYTDSKIKIKNNVKADPWQKISTEPITKDKSKWMKEVSASEFDEIIKKIKKDYPNSTSKVYESIAESIFGDIFMLDGVLTELFVSQGEFYTYNIDDDLDYYGATPY